MGCESECVNIHRIESLENDFRDLKKKISQEHEKFYSRIEELERRIRGRRTEAEDVVRERLDKASKEIATKDEYKYVVENDDVLAAKEHIAKIIKENS